MDANMKKRNELLAKTVIKGLESRNMSGYYVQDREAALKQGVMQTCGCFVIISTLLPSGPECKYITPS